MKIVPQQSRIIVELIKEDHYGSIAIPDSIEQPDYARCKVVAIGPGRTLENGTVIPVPLGIGDEVVFDARFAAKLEPKCIYGDQDLAVIDYAGVLCKVERAPDEPVFTRPKKKKIEQPILVS